MFEETDFKEFVRKAYQIGGEISDIDLELEEAYD